MREKYINCGYPNPDEHAKLVELDRAKKFNESYVKWQRLKKSNEIENGSDSASDLSLCNEIENDENDENVLDSSPCNEIDYVLDLSPCNEIGNDSDSISSLSD